MKSLIAHPTMEGLKYYMCTRLVRKQMETTFSIGLQVELELKAGRSRNVPLGNGRATSYLMSPHQYDLFARALRAHTLVILCG